MAAGRNCEAGATITTKFTVKVAPMTEWRKSNVVPLNFLHKQ